MKYDVGMGSSVMIYMTKFCKDWFSHSNVKKGGGRHRHTDISLLLFFQNKNIRLIKQKQEQYSVMLY
jgi:hypothetical protein